MKLAVILHIYYKEQIPYILTKLQNLDNAGVNYDLFITSPHPMEEISKMFEKCQRNESQFTPSPAVGDTNKHISNGLEECRCLKRRHDRGVQNRYIRECRHEMIGAMQAPNHSPAVGDKFCEMTADVLPERGAYKMYARGAATVTQPQTGLYLESQFTKFIPTENKGYDIAPFIHTLKSLNLDTYDYVLKLHTKGTANTNYTKLNGKHLNNALWGKILWNSLLGSKTQILDNINTLEKNQKIGLVTAKYCLTNAPQNYQNLLPQINQELTRLGYPMVQKLSFAAGTMFLTRANILKPFLKYNIEDFPPTNGKIKEGTLAHIIERLFGAVTIAQGYTLAPLPHKTYKTARILSALKRFLYQKKQTSKGKTLIKICKIPVYRSTTSKSNTQINATI